LRPEDHFYFSRPIPTGARNWPNPRFRYGSTYFGEETTHTGVDLGAARGTDIVAAGPGEIVWVGYGLYRGIEDPTDPYGLSIAIRHDFGYQDQQLFTVYAHLSSADVWRGQRVEMNDKIGTVGETGHSSGPHLHFEVRLGENRFFSTRNPELWMVPSEGTGVLAGQVLSTRGLPLAEQLIQIHSLETGQRWEVWTYAIGTVHPDERYNENFAIGDLPAGGYEIKINFVGRSYLKYLYLHPGQTNMIYFQGRQGFQSSPDNAAYNLSQPPY
jgi:murein DD-endopeptidase MepM/ murein hydrolase activator NlpD